MSVSTGFLVKLATVPGTMMMVWANTIGMTPAVISRIGMKVFWPSRIRPRPMTFRGIWIGIRRAAMVIATPEAIAPTATRMRITTPRTEITFVVTDEARRARVVDEGLQGGHVHSGRRDVRADPIDEHREQGEEELPLELLVHAEGRHLGRGHLPLHLPARRFDLGPRRCRQGDAPDGVGPVGLAGGEQLDRIAQPAHQPRRVQRLGVELGDGELLELVQVPRLGLRLVRVGEPALGEPAVHRHLAALEARIGPAAGAGLVSLVPLPRGLAEAGARAAAEPLP